MSTSPTALVPSLTGASVAIALCACGHTRESHHRGVAICRKISCPCAAYHAETPTPAP